MSSEVKEVFSSVDWVGGCLADGERTRAFELAINRNVRKGDLVLDIGTGSGILALFAARAGARQVIALEIDPYLAQLARENIVRNGYGDVVEVITADSTIYRFEPGLVFDLVTMELLTTGMIDEHQIGALNNLHRQKVVKPTTAFIPERQDTFVRLASTDFKLYGFDMRFPLHLWRELNLSRRTVFLSQEALLSRVDFRGPIQPRCSHLVDLDLYGLDPVATPPNSLYLTSTSVLDAEISLGWTAALNAPVVIPLGDDLPLPEHGGGKLALQFDYVFGGGFSAFCCSSG